MIRRFALILVTVVLFVGWMRLWGVFIGFYSKPSLLLMWVYGLGSLVVVGMVGYLIWLHFLKRGN